MTKKPEPVVFKLTEMAKAVKMAFQNSWWRPDPKDPKNAHVKKC